MSFEQIGVIWLKNTEKHWPKASESNFFVVFILEKTKLSFLLYTPYGYGGLIKVKSVSMVESVSK